MSTTHANSCTVCNPQHCVLQIELVQLGIEGGKPTLTTKPISEEVILRVTEH